MADPFEALRLPSPAIDPDPTFAARLRSRVERALALPEGVTVSELTIETAAVGVSAPPRRDRHGRSRPCLSGALPDRRRSPAGDRLVCVGPGGGHGAR